MSGPCVPSSHVDPPTVTEIIRISMAAVLKGTLLSNSGASGPPGIEGYCGRIH